MGKVTEIQDMFKEVATHIEAAKEFVTLLATLMEKVTENLPAEDVAKLISVTGGWLGTALKPINTAFSKMQDRWMAKQVKFIKKTTGVKKISEETAIRLVSIRAGQLRDTAKHFTDGHKSNNRSK